MNDLEFLGKINSQRLKSWDEEFHWTATRSAENVSPLDKVVNRKADWASDLGGRTPPVISR